MVEDVVLPEHELEEDDSHWPDVGFVGLVRVVENGLDGHVGLGSDFIAAHDLQAFPEFLVHGDLFIEGTHIHTLPHQVLPLALQHFLEISVDLSQTKVNYNPAPPLSVVQEIPRLYVAVEDAHFLQTLQSD